MAAVATSKEVKTRPKTEFMHAKAMRSRMRMPTKAAKSFLSVKALLACVGHIVLTYVTTIAMLIRPSACRQRWGGTLSNRRNFPMAAGMGNSIQAARSKNAIQRKRLADLVRRGARAGHGIKSVAGASQRYPVPSQILSNGAGKRASVFQKS